MSNALKSVNAMSIEKYFGGSVVQKYFGGSVVKNILKYEV